MACSPAIPGSCSTCSRASLTGHPHQLCPKGKYAHYGIMQVIDAFWQNSLNGNQGLPNGNGCLYCCHLRDLLPRMLIAVLQQSALASLLSFLKGANEGLRSIQLRCMAQPQPEAGAAR